MKILLIAFFIAGADFVRRYTVKAARKRRWSLIKLLVMTILLQTLYLLLAVAFIFATLSLLGDLQLEPLDKEGYAFFSAAYVILVALGLREIVGDIKSESKRTET